MENTNKQVSNHNRSYEMTGRQKNGNTDNYAIASRNERGAHTILHRLSDGIFTSNGKHLGTHNGVVIYRCATRSFRDPPDL